MRKSYALVAIPVDSFLKTIEVDIFGRSDLLEYTTYERLLRGRHRRISTPAHEIRIAAEAGDACRHELFVLVRVQATLEVCEAERVALWLVVAVEGTVAVGSGKVRIEYDIPLHAALTVVPYPCAETVFALGTVVGQASLVIMGYCCRIIVHRMMEFIRLFLRGSSEDASLPLRLWGSYFKK